jgi:hypothetical protein
MVAEVSLSTGQVILHVLSTLGFYFFTLPVSLPGSLVHGTPSPLFVPCLYFTNFFLAPLGILCKAIANYLSQTATNGIDRDHGIDRDQVAHYKVT